MEIPLDTGLAVLALCVLRIAPVVAFVPAFGGESLPMRVRIALVASFAFILAPRVVEGVGSVPQGIEFLPAALSEAVAGAVIAFAVRAAFEVASAAGAWIDQARGASSSQLFDPLIRSVTSPLETLVRMSAIVAFVSAGGHRALVAGLLASYDCAPLGGFVTDGAATGMHVITTIAGLLIASLAIAAPVVALLFLIDVGLSFVNRVAPQIQLFTLGFIVKPIGGIVLAIIVIASAIEAVSDGALATLGSWTTGR